MQSVDDCTSVATIFQSERERNRKSLRKDGSSFCLFGIAFVEGRDFYFQLRCMGCSEVELLAGMYNWGNKARNNEFWLGNRRILYKREVVQWSFRGKIRSRSAGSVMHQLHNFIKLDETELL